MGKKLYYKTNTFNKKGHLPFPYFILKGHKLQACRSHTAIHKHTCTFINFHKNMCKMINTVNKLPFHHIGFHDIRCISIATIELTQTDVILPLGLNLINSRANSCTIVFNTRFKFHNKLHLGFGRTLFFLNE